MEEGLRIPDTSPAVRLVRPHSLATLILVGAPGFEPGVTCSQNRHVSRYTTPRKNSFQILSQEKAIGEHGD